VAGPEPVPDTEWRLEVEIREESGAPVSGCVYVTDAKGELLAALDTEPPAPAVHMARGTVGVIAHATGYVPLIVEGLTRPPSGVRSLVARVERGGSISGTIVDDDGEPVTTERAWAIRVLASPLDPPPWFLQKSESWSSQTDSAGEWLRFEVFPIAGTFRIEGLLPGRHNLYCELNRRRGLRPDPRGALLNPPPLLVAGGDADVRLVCPRAVEVCVRFVDADTGRTIPSECGASWEVSGENGILEAASGALDSGGLRFAVAPGASFTVAATAEAYEPPEPLHGVANREPGLQEMTLKFRREPGGFAALELLVRDDLGAPATPLMVGPFHSLSRMGPEDGRYVLKLPAGDQRVRLCSPGDQILLFKPEWIPSMHDPDDFPPARAYLPLSIEADLPRGGRVVRELTIQRAALIWVQQEPKGAFPTIRLLRGGTEVEHALRDLYEEKGLVAAVEPGTYTVEGTTGERVARIEVAAEPARVAEVWLRAADAK
jgi:hypothetical protein